MVSQEHAQKDNDRLALAAVDSLVRGRVPGSLVKETMPVLQRGQGSEPGGPFWDTEVEFVVQRYSAHLVQNSWLQP